MSTTKFIAKHLREVCFGGNWSASNWKDALTGVTWQEATTQIYGLNSIAALTFHATYYVAAILKVLQGEPLNAKDAYSFLLPPINSQKDWEQLLDEAWENAEQAAELIEKMPDSQLEEVFSDEKYGSYHRNLHGMIEHLHYHLGQVVLIKKILTQTEKM